MRCAILLILILLHFVFFIKNRTLFLIFFSCLIICQRNLLHFLNWRHFDCIKNRFWLVILACFSKDIYFLYLLLLFWLWSLKFLNYFLFFWFFFISNHFKISRFKHSLQISIGFYLLRPWSFLNFQWLHKNICSLFDILCYWSFEVLWRWFYGFCFN